MAINPILNSVSAALAQQSAPFPVRSAAQSQVVADAPFGSSSGTSDSSPSQPVLQTAGLLSASSNLAQLGSLLEVAQSGTEQISSVLAQLQTLAQSAGSSDDAADVESVFQQVYAQLDQTASTTTFGGTKLLDGSLSQSSDTAGAPGLSLPDLSAQGLFGSQQLDISTPQGAAAAINAIASAQAIVSDTGSSIESALGQVSFAAASVDTVIANNTAAGSTLGEEDVGGGSGDSGILSALFGSPAAAVQAQTGNLSGNLLSLLQE